jgi:type II secretory pathway component PulF
MSPERAQPSKAITRTTARTWIGAGERLRHVAEFTRQLAVLVGTGTPLVDALTSLEKQAKPGPWKDVLARVRSRTEEGSPLSDAMAEHPLYFDGVCQSLVAAGESGGKLEVLLDSLASLTRQQLRVRMAVVGALTYPALLILIALGVTISMIAFVLPRFEGLFKTLSTPLPTSTKILMSMSDALRGHWLLFGIGAMGSIAGALWWLRSQAGQESIQRAMVSLPLTGPCARAIITARLARVLGVLVEGKVPLLDSIRLARGSTAHAMYADLMSRAENAIVKGDTLASELERSPLVSPSVCEAVRSGEKTGQLGKVLLTLANYMDEDNEVTIRTMTRLVEPVILIILGLMVGTIAISMFLPLFDLTSAAGGGG